MIAPLRLALDGAALVANWRTLAALHDGAACGAAVKADGYGLGAQGVVDRLAAAGCRDFFVATWAEAAAIRLPERATLSVLHGVRADDMAAARSIRARPVLCTAAQIARWREAGGGACDVMVDTGMNRLGLTPEEAVSGLLDGLDLHTLMSHLACADEPGHALNERQRLAFAEVCARVPAQRRSLANSAGTLLGPDYGLDLLRPGLALYGGSPADAMDGLMQPVVGIEAQVLQLRHVPAGETVGYGGAWRAERPSLIAIVNLGYADGFLRALGPVGRAEAGDAVLPIVGRISMDLIALDATDAARMVDEGAWVRVPVDLPVYAGLSGLTQYELLTGLGRRFDRVWR